MYTVFYECSDIIETTDAHFFKKVRSLRYKYFSTNNTEHNMNLKVKEAWKNLLVMISIRQNEKFIFISFPFNSR